MNWQPLLACVVVASLLEYGAADSERAKAVRALKMVTCAITES